MLFLVLDVLQIVFLSRLFLKALLEVRNDVLARSIRETCLESVAAAAAAAAAGRGGGSGGSVSGGGVGDVGAVVAVLGAAHLNGVQMRLMDAVEEGVEGAPGWWEATTTAAARGGGGEGLGDV